MLSSSKKSFENHRPLQFIEFLTKNNIVDTSTISDIAPQQEKDFLVHNSPFSHYFYLLHIFKTISSFSGHQIPTVDTYIWLKRVWNEFFRNLNANYDLDFYNKSLKVVLYKFEKYFEQIEELLIKNDSLYLNYRVDTSIQKTEFIKEMMIDEKVLSSWIKECNISRKKKVQHLPLLKTHPCLVCDVVENERNTDYNLIEFLYSLKSIVNSKKIDNIDFFYERSHSVLN